MFSHPYKKCFVSFSKLTLDITTLVEKNKYIIDKFEKEKNKLKKRLIDQIKRFEGLIAIIYKL